jgi:hypothetical protein
MKLVSGSKQALLEQRVAQTIRDSGMTLDELQGETGIHRSKLGRMRLSKVTITCDEAEKVFSAVRCPSRAYMILAALGEERTLTSEAMAYLENLLTDLPSLLDRLNDLGPTLNPKWAHGSVHHLGVLMSEHADRRTEADAFRPGLHPRNMS